MQMKASLVLFAFAFIASVNAHTWLQCTDMEGNQCRGHIRNYRARNIQGSVDDFYTHRVLGQPNDAPLCKPDTQATMSYNDQYPMATAYPGDTLRVMYTPNGHSRPGDPGVTTTSRIHWTGRPNSQLQVRGDLNEGNRLAEWAYGNNCATEPGCTGGCAYDSLPCVNGFTLPNNIEPGIYSFVYYWPYNRNAGQVPYGEEYFSCFEVNVLAREGGGRNPETEETPVPSDPINTNEANEIDEASSIASLSAGFLGIVAVVISVISV